MVALVALVLILAVFGGLGFAVNLLWYVLIAAILFVADRLLHRRGA